MTLNDLEWHNSPSKQHAHYTCGKIAIKTNKEYNGILTYTPIGRIPRLSDMWN